MGSLSLAVKIILVVKLKIRKTRNVPRRTALASSPLVVVVTMIIIMIVTIVMNTRYHHAILKHTPLSLMVTTLKTVTTCTILPRQPFN